MLLARLMNAARWLALATILPACAPAASPRPAPSPTASSAAVEVPAAPVAPPFDATTQASLTQSVARLFSEASAAFKVQVVEPLTLHVDASDTDKHDLRVSLDRVWATCQSDAPHCEREARSFVTKAVAAIEKPAAKATRDQVVAVLRPRAYFDSIGGTSAADTVVEPFVGDLFVAYVVDLPQSVRSLGPGDMTTLGLTRADLPAVARANLSTRLGGSPPELARSKAGDVSVIAGSNYFESSRLLLTEDWTALATKLGKPIFAAAPANDVLVIAIAPAAEQLGKLRAGIEGLYQSSDQPVSPQVYRWDAGRWIATP
jgi:uncharacterized protein YtpQ (UPF0354 family)